MIAEGKTCYVGWQRNYTTLTRRKSLVLLFDWTRSTFKELIFKEIGRISDETVSVSIILCNSFDTVVEQFPAPFDSASAVRKMQFVLLRGNSCISHGLAKAKKLLHPNDLANVVSIMTSSTDHREVSAGITSLMIQPRTSVLFVHRVAPTSSLMVGGCSVPFKHYLPYFPLHENKAVSSMYTTLLEALKCSHSAEFEIHHRMACQLRTSPTHSPFLTPVPPRTLSPLQSPRQTATSSKYSPRPVPFALSPFTCPPPSNPGMSPSWRRTHKRMRTMQDEMEPLQLPPALLMPHFNR